MTKYLNIAQIVLSIVLIAAILIQGRGVGLSGVFGGEGNVFRTKRGLEKSLHYVTIGLVVAFFFVALLNVYLAK